MSIAVLSKSPRELRTAREEHCSSHRDSLPSEHNMVIKRRGDSRASKHGKGLRLFLRSTSIRAQSLMTVILKTALRGPRQLSPHAQYELTNKNIRPLEQSTGKVKTLGHSNSPRSRSRRGTQDGLKTVILKTASRRTSQVGHYTHRPVLATQKTLV